MLCGGAALVVTLRGVALQEDKYKHERTQLEVLIVGRGVVEIPIGVLRSTNNYTSNRLLNYI